MKHALFLVAVAITSCGNDNESVTIIGTVIDADTKLPLSGAKVSIGEIMDITLSDGTYQLYEVPGGEQIIVTQLAGYATDSKMLNLSPGTNVKTFDIYLKRVIIRCEEDGIETKTYTSQVVVDAKNNSVVSSLVDTGLNVIKGDKIQITTTGKWSISPSDPFTDANGYAGKFSAGLPLGSLIGQIGYVPIKVGEPGWSAFFIGTNYIGIASSNGKLFLGFNDTDFVNNLGSVTANIKVTGARGGCDSP